MTELMEKMPYMSLCENFLALSLAYKMHFFIMGKFLYHRHVDVKSVTIKALFWEVEGEYRDMRGDSSAWMKSSFVGVF